MIVTLEEVAGVLVTSDKVFDQRDGGALQRFIGIEHQDPRVSGACNGVIAGSGKINNGEVEGNYFGAVAGGDLSRRIG